MFKHIRKQFMDKTMQHKFAKDGAYYYKFYGNAGKYINAALNNDIETMKNCIMLGGVDVNYRLRYRPESRCDSDLTALTIAISSYNFDMVKMLFELGASTEGIFIKFNSDDRFTPNSGNLERAIELCKKYNIPYKVGDEDV